MIAYSNKFSVSRAISYGKLFSPWMKRMLIIYPLVSVLISVLCIWFGLSPYGMVFIALLSFIPAAMIYFGSLVFGIHVDRYIEVLAPATWYEKATFTVVYSLIVLPLLVAIPGQLILWLSARIPTIADGNAWIELKMLNYNSTGYIYIWNIAQSIIPASVCLLSLMIYSSRRVLMAVIWSVVSLIGISIVGGLFGFITGLNMAKNESDVLKSNSPQDIINVLVANMEPSLLIMSICGTVVLILLVCLIFNKFRNRQV